MHKFINGVLQLGAMPAVSQASTKLHVLGTFVLLKIFDAQIKPQCATYYAIIVLVI